MVIRLIQGKIASGKTYYPANHVLRSYYTWSDELDSWVPKEKDVDVFLFFLMHRHLGCDIYLITQDTRCLAKELQQLSEYVIKAVRHSNSIGKSFTYKFYSGDE